MAKHKEQKIKLSPRQKKVLREERKKLEGKSRLHSLLSAQIRLTEEGIPPRLLRDKNFKID